MIPPLSSSSSAANGLFSFPKSSPRRLHPQPASGQQTPLYPLKPSNNCLLYTCARAHTMHSLLLCTASRPANTCITKCTALYGIIISMATSLLDRKLLPTGPPRKSTFSLHHRWLSRLTALNCNTDGQVTFHNTAGGWDLQGYQFYRICG